MAKALRITFKGTDYSFTILSEQPISKGISKVPILLGDKTITLVYSNGKWLSAEQDSEIDDYLLDAIGKAIGLRYRF